jgi:hypothetical protein
MEVSLQYHLLSASQGMPASTLASAVPLLYHPIAAPPRLNLNLTQLPQLINTWRIPRQHALRHLRRPSNSRLPHHRIRSRVGLDANNANAGIFRPAVMRAVPEVAQPGLQSFGVVLLDRLAVRLDGGEAGDGGPFAGGVQEGDVDVRVGLQLIRLAGLGVGVKDEVDAAAFL